MAITTLIEDERIDTGEREMMTRNEMIGPWAGMPVAWDENLRFDEQAYRADVARICKAGVPGVYTAGTTGEFYAMELDEWKAVAKATVEECRAHGTPVMLGVTSTYTLGAQRRAEFAAELEADAIQLALPFWMEVDDRQVAPFFRDVASASPGLAMTVYETLRAKKSLSVDQHREIYDETGCYLAVKANAGTIGRDPDGCRALSEFINVWVGENEILRLAPHGANGCAAARLDLLVQLGVPLRVHPRLAAQLGLHLGHLLGEPVLHLLHQDVAVVEPAVDQVHGLALQVSRTRR